LTKMLTKKLLLPADRTAVKRVVTTDCKVKRESSVRMRVVIPELKII
jgi:hypothetical protein